MHDSTLNSSLCLKLAANNLRVINDGYILKSELCMMVGKLSLMNKELQKLIKLLSTQY